MPSITDRINKRLRAIQEAEEASLTNAPWKDPNSPEYDRQKAEDALYHTVGPLTDEPRWDVPKSGKPAWTSPGEPAPGFTPGGPAPRWTPDEVVLAYAGDPSLLFKGSKDHPHSPHYGNKGGAPLYRLARKVARYYARDNDRSFIMDLYGNGFIPLVQAMQSGRDESRSAFISWITRNVQSAMEHGVGGEERTNRAAGADSTTGLRGVQALEKETDPEAVRRAADDVKGKYREIRSHDKHPDNPFGHFSSKYYQLATMYADALETGDEQRIEGARNQLMQLKDEIDDYSVNIRGASTGLGQAISTPDRVKKDPVTGEIENPVNLQSMDVTTPGGDDARTMAGNIVGDDTRDEDPTADPEMVKYILDIALNYDLGTLLQGTRYEGLGLGGKLNPNEFRFVIRGLGPLGTNYPGRGYIRENVDIPREARGWWQAGEDPEIEPIPTGGKWTSIWLRNGGPYEAPSEIAVEMTEEIREFNKLGIATARKIKKKKNKRGKEWEEAISNAAVIPAQKKALAKLQAIREIHADQLGIDDRTQFENAKRSARIINESFDRIDCMLVVETTEVLARRLLWGLVLEMAPKYKTSI